MDRYSLYEFHDPDQNLETKSEKSDPQLNTSTALDFDFVFEKISNPYDISLKMFLYLMNQIFEQYPEQYIDVKVQEELYKKVAEMTPENTLTIDGFKMILFDLIFSIDNPQLNNTYQFTEENDQIQQQEPQEQQQQQYMLQDKQSYSSANSSSKKSRKMAEFDDQQEEEQKKDQVQEQEQIYFTSEVLTSQNANFLYDIMQNLSELEDISKDDFLIICQECNITEIFNQIEKFCPKQTYKIQQLKQFYHQFEQQCIKQQQINQSPLFKFDARKSVYNVQNDISEDYNNFMNNFLDLVNSGLKESQGQVRFFQIFKQIDDQCQELDLFVSKIEQKFKQKEEEIEKSNFDSIQLTKQFQNLQQIQDMKERDLQQQFQELQEIQEQYKELQLECDKKDRDMEKLIEEQKENDGIIQGLNIQLKNFKQSQNSIKVISEEYDVLQNQNHSLRKELQELELKYEELQEKSENSIQISEGSKHDQSIHDQDAQETEKMQQKPQIQKKETQKILQEFEKLMEENAKYQEKVFKKNTEIENMTFQFQQDLSDKDSEIYKYKKNIEQLEDQIQQIKKKELNFKQQLQNIQSGKKMNLQGLFSTENPDQFPVNRPTIKNLENNQEFELDINYSRPGSIIKNDPNDFLFQPGRLSFVPNNRPSVVQQNLFVVNESHIDPHNQTLQEDSQFVQLHQEIDQQQQMSESQQKTVENQNYYIEQIEKLQHENLAMKKTLFELEQQLKQFPGEEKKQEEGQEKNQDIDDEERSKIKERTSVVCFDIIKRQKSKKENKQSEDNIIQEQNETEENAEKSSETGSSQHVSKHKVSEKSSIYTPALNKKMIQNLRLKIKKNQYLEKKDFLNLKKNIPFKKIANKHGILSNMKVLFSDRGYLFSKQGKRRQDCVIIINEKSILFLNLFDFKPISPPIDIAQLHTILLSETSQTMTILKLAEQQDKKKIIPVNLDEFIEAHSNKPQNFGYISIENFKRQDLISFAANIYKQTQKKQLPIEYAPQNEFQLVQNYYDTKPKSASEKKKIEKRMKTGTEQLKHYYDNLLNNKMFNTIKTLGFLNYKTKPAGIIDKITSDKWLDQFVILTEIGLICLKSPSDREGKIVPVTSETIISKIPSSRDRKFLFVVAERIDYDHVKEVNPHPKQTLDFTPYQQFGEVFCAVSKGELNQWLGYLEEFQDNRTMKEQQQIIDEIQQISNVEGNLNSV